MKNSTTGGDEIKIIHLKDRSAQLLVISVKYNIQLIEIGRHGTVKFQMQTKEILIKENSACNSFHEPLSDTMNKREIHDIVGSKMNDL